MSLALKIGRLGRFAFRSPRVSQSFGTRRVFLCGTAFVTGAYLHQHRARCDPSLLSSLKSLAPVIDANSMLKQFVSLMEDSQEERVSLPTLKLLFHEAGIQDESIAESIFRIMDWDNNGYLDQSEVAAVMTLFQSGNDQDKWKFLFRCIDLDGSNSVDKLEFRSMLTALLDAKYHLHGLVDDRTPSELYHGIEEEEFHTVAKFAANKIVRDIFFVADKNHDGELSMKEFLYWCMRGGKEVEMVTDLLQQTLSHK